MDSSSELQDQSITRDSFMRTLTTGCHQGQSYTKKRAVENQLLFLSGYCDSNTGPSGPKPDALTNCATPRLPFGTANIRRKNKSANFFYKILHF